DKALDGFIKKRYAGWDSGIGKKIENREVTFEDLEAYTLKKGEPEVPSGRQELLENILNDYIC
ncbi:MAG TPA: xylose isomerase, partial [Candidatus Hydrogenedentes bacterium]|nr:xylose isomerase [Candidatus Hydrogenedentota bacterium]